MYEEVIACENCGDDEFVVREIPLYLDQITGGETQAPQDLRCSAFECKCLHCGHTQRFYPTKEDVD